MVKNFIKFLFKSQNLKNHLKEITELRSQLLKAMVFIDSHVPSANATMESNGTKSQNKFYLKSPSDNNFGTSFDEDDSPGNKTFKKLKFFI